MARQTNEKSRGHTERRCLANISVAASQAGVNDLIVFEYSSRGSL
jgi:hypothetical protein